MRHIVIAFRTTVDHSIPYPGIARWPPAARANASESNSVWESLLDDTIRMIDVLASLREIHSLAATIWIESVACRTWKRKLKLSLLRLFLMVGVHNRLIEASFTVPICDCCWMRPKSICGRHFCCNPIPWIRWLAAAFPAILLANYWHQMAQSRSRLSDAFLYRKRSITLRRRPHFILLQHTQYPRMSTIAPNFEHKSKQLKRNKRTTNCQTNEQLSECVHQKSTQILREFVNLTSGGGKKKCSSRYDIHK